MTKIRSEKRLDQWLTPFLDVLGDKRRRRWAPLYIMGLLLPGERKSMQPISSRVAPDDVEQIHHFVATLCWDTAPLEEVLWQKVDALLGDQKWAWTTYGSRRLGHDSGVAT